MNCNFQILCPINLLNCFMFKDIDNVLLAQKGCCQIKENSINWFGNLSKRRMPDYTSTKNQVPISYYQFELNLVYTCTFGYTLFLSIELFYFGRFWQLGSLSKVDLDSNLLLINLIGFSLVKESKTIGCFESSAIVVNVNQNASRHDLCCFPWPWLVPNGLIQFIPINIIAFLIVSDPRAYFLNIPLCFSYYVIYYIMYVKLCLFTPFINLARSFYIASILSHFALVLYAVAVSRNINSRRAYQASLLLDCVKMRILLFTNNNT